MLNKKQQLEKLATQYVTLLMAKKIINKRITKIKCEMTLLTEEMKQC